MHVEISRSKKTIARLNFLNFCRISEAECFGGVKKLYANMANRTGMKFFFGIVVRIHLRYKPSYIANANFKWLHITIVREMYSLHGQISAKVD